MNTTTKQDFKLLSAQEMIENGSKIQYQPTPTPWRIFGRNEQKSTLLNARGETIATGESNAAIRGDELESSLRLASAAPELLDALELCLDGLETYAPEFMHGMPKSAYIKRAEKAIAKARGETE